MKMNLKNEKTTYTALIIIITLLLLSPLIFKTGFREEVYTSQETYKNLLEKQTIQENETIQEQIIQNNPYHILLNQIPLSNINLAILIPLITGIISILLMIYFLRIMNISDNETTLILITFALTPIFLQKFMTLNPDNFAFPLLLISGILYLKKSYLTIIPIILMIFINPVLGILFIILTILHLFLNKERIKITTATLITSIITITTYIIINKELPIRVKTAMLDNVLIELGSTTGYSMPLIILSAIGLFTWWEKGIDRTLITTSLIAAFTISIFLPELRLITAFTLAIFAGIGINQLATREWELKKIKYLALLILFCIILFSAIITINTQLTQITKQEVEAARFLSSANTNGTILSTEEKGFMIQYLSGKETFLDGETYKHVNYIEKKEITQKIFYTRRLNDLEQLLNENNIKYIYIYEDMRQGKIWSGRDEGLLFFLTYSEKFLQLFDNEEVQIYKYIKNVE